MSSPAPQITRTLYDLGGFLKVGISVILGQRCSLCDFTRSMLAIEANAISHEVPPARCAALLLRPVILDASPASPRPQALHGSLAILEREMNVVLLYLGNVGTQAALIAGFIFAIMVDGPGDGVHPVASFFAMTSTVICFSAMIFTVVCATVR